MLEVSEIRNITMLIKASLLSYCVFERGWLAVTEYQLHYGSVADVVAIDSKGRVIEIEVKANKSDFSADFVNKKTKHSLLKNKLIDYIPNKFYFCLPKEFEEFAIKKLDKENKEYGLLIWSKGSYSKCGGISVSRRSRLLNTNIDRFGESFKFNLMKRLCREIVSFHQERCNYKVRCNKCNDEIIV